MIRRWSFLNFCLIGMVLVSFWPPNALGLDQTEILDLFSKGKEDFRQAVDLASSNPRQARELYSMASLRFERIVREGGIQNGKLYYNIGNAYFSMGEMGLAILNYLRALKFTPNDPNLLQNIQYARSQRKDQFEFKNQNPLLKSLLFWHFDLSSQTRSIIFALSSGAFWAGALLRLFPSPSLPRWILVGLGCSALLFLGSLSVDKALEVSSKKGVILAYEVLGRKGDGESYQPSFKEPLHAGSEFVLIEERNNWIYIELPDSRRTWIPQKTSQLVSSPPG